MNTRKFINKRTHCCPANYECNVDQGKCDLKNDMGYILSIKWSEKIINNKDDQMCPDGQSECPSGSTCCKLDNGEYGCCPLPNAVCCDDHVETKIILIFWFKFLKKYAYFLLFFYYN